MVVLLERNIGQGRMRTGLKGRGYDLMNGSSMGRDYLKCWKRLPVHVLSKD